MIAAQHIKNLRLKHNYSQNYIAHELKVSQKTYSNLECGKAKITLEHLFKLSTIYHIDIASFIQLINKGDSKTLNSITSQYPSISNDELYNGINNELPFELINQLKARIDDLNKLIQSKNTRIDMLLSKVRTLEGKTNLT
jgi:transcriptional regulator with XRE-family HTH domain